MHIVIICYGSLLTSSKVKINFIYVCNTDFSHGKYICKIRVEAYFKTMTSKLYEIVNPLLHEHFVKNGCFH
jgi:hypothetical protein